MNLTHLHNIILIIIIYSLCALNNAYAQSTIDYKPLLDSLDYLVNNTKNDDAICYGEELLDAYGDDLYEHQDTLLGHIYNQIGAAYFNNFDTKIAQIYYKKTIALLSSAPLNVILIKAHDLMGNSYKHQKDFSKAEKHLNAALAMLDQLPYEAPKRKAVVLKSIASLKYRQGDLNLAEDLLIQANTLIETTGSKHLISSARIKHDLATIKGHKALYHESIKYFKEAYEPLSAYDINHPSNGIMLMNIGVIYIQIGKFSEAEKYLKRNLDLYVNAYGYESTETASVYTRLGLLHLKSFNYKKAIADFNEALQIASKVNKDDFKVLTLAYLGLAEAYLTQGDYEKGILYYKKNIDLLTTVYGKNHHFLSHSYNQLGHAYLKTRNHVDALAAFQTTKKLFPTNKLDHLYGKVYLIAGQYENAISSLTKALSLDQQPTDIITILTDLGQAYKEIKKTDKAIEYYTTALQEIDQFYKDDTPTKAKVYINLADIYISNNNESQALSYLNRAAKCINYEPDATNNFQSTSDLFVLLDLLDVNTRYYKMQYNSNPSEENKKILLNEFQTIFSLIDFIQKQIAVSASKQKILADSYRLFENAIDFLTSINNSDAIAEAFRLTEKSKNILLSESLRISQAEDVAGIPTSDLEQEYNLNARLAYYQHKLQEEKHEKASPSDSLISIYQDSIFNIKKENEQLITRFEKRYPAYYDLKYAHNTLSLPSIQKKLKPDESLLEYFVGDSSIYIFIVQQGKAQIKKVRKDFPLKELVQQMRESTYNYWINFEKPDSVFTASKVAYCQAAYQLYQSLIEPVSDGLTKKLIIIPDDILALLPFDALLSESTDHTQDYFEFPYLINKYTISYDYSASIHYQSKKSPSKSQYSFLGFAPQFEETMTAKNRSIDEIRNSLSKLNHNEKEVENIDALFNGKVFIGETATKAQFLDHAKKAYLLHLATHGKANEQVGDQSFIAFSEIIDSTTYNDRLYVRELYKLDLNAAMVVLSACETGLGELRKGEGIISLSRGFTFAGAQSVIPSLWQVNDQATAEFMATFYRTLKTGLPKDEALRIAKIQSIENVQTAPPFFWAAFVPIGNMDPIADRWDISPLWIILIIIPIGFLFMAFRNKSKKA
ncbi:MAG: CHAT domain-containing protein [Chitinophagales bacterium]|nr:CHAT domain-containing protein [Chitinophagales bacterium]